MQNKKSFIILSLLVLLVGAAAFIAGRLLNQKAGPVGLGGPFGDNMLNFSINIVPAEELPKTSPEIMGIFVERRDNTIVVSSFALDAGGGGAIAVESSGGGEGVASSADPNSGPKVEVVVTNETIIYRETTEIGESPSNEDQTIQQTVEEATLDELNTQSMVTVWGRKSGDRIIAEVLFYSKLVIIQSP